MGQQIFEFKGTITASIKLLLKSNKQETKSKFDDALLECSLRSADKKCQAFGETSKCENKY